MSDLAVVDGRGQSEAGQTGRKTVVNHQILCTDGQYSRHVHSMKLVILNFINIFGSELFLNGDFLQFQIVIPNRTLADEHERYVNVSRLEAGG